MRISLSSIFTIISSIIVATTINAAPRARAVDASSFLPAAGDRSTPAVALGGSRWELEFPKEIFCHAIFDFLPNGQLQALIDDGDSRLGWNKVRGNWAQDGDRVVVVVNGVTLFDGVVAGEAMEGNASTLEGTRKTPFIARTGVGLANFKNKTAGEAVEVRKRMAEDAVKTMDKIVESGRSSQGSAERSEPREASGPVKVQCSACSGRGGHAPGYKGLQFGANFKRCRVCDGTGLVWVGR